jgi:hypothetical protein
MISIILVQIPTSTEGNYLMQLGILETILPPNITYSYRRNTIISTKFLHQRIDPKP